MEKQNYDAIDKTRKGKGIVIEEETTYNNLEYYEKYKISEDSYICNENKQLRSITVPRKIKMGTHIINTTALIDTGCTTS